MTILLDALCPKCSSLALNLTAKSAFHDASLIELVAECDDCDAVFDAFVPIKDMNLVEEE
ncbi:hypothetical protein [Pseudomonas putida]|uniref:hypothetical protein n=1 Tax=Pseudomonas putida TaxID=303 RepID=UPI004046DD68